MDYHWHRLGERCICGHLTAPARFYWAEKDGKPLEVSQEKAEAAYLDWLKGNKPELWEKLVIDHSLEMKKVQTAAFHAITGRLPGQPHPRPKSSSPNNQVGKSSWGGRRKGAGRPKRG